MTWSPPIVSPRLSRAVRAVACLAGADVGDLDTPRDATQMEWTIAAIAWPWLRADLHARRR